MDYFGTPAETNLKNVSSIIKVIFGLTNYALEYEDKTSFYFKVSSVFTWQSEVICYFE